MTTSDHNLLNELSRALGADPFAGGGRGLRPTPVPAHRPRHGAIAAAAAGFGKENGVKGKYAREAEFADHLAEGKTIPQIRKIMGLTNGTAQGIMLSIRRQLGAQAI